MNAKFLKSAVEKKGAKKDDQHIAPVAGRYSASF